MNLEAAFKAPQNLIDWANMSLSEADALTDTFLHPDNFARTFELDPQTGEHVDKFKVIRDIPVEIPRKLTEGINNLRNSFDQALFCFCAAINKPIKDAHYPWASNPTDLEWKFQNKKRAKFVSPPKFGTLSARSNHTRLGRAIPAETT